MHIRAFAAPVAHRSVGSQGTLRVPSARQPFARRRVASPPCAGYQFGDITRGLAKGAKEQLDKLGQSVTGDESYQFGDLTRKTLGTLTEQAGARGVELRQLSSEALSALRQYRFGSITQSLLQTEWGKEVVAQAEAAGRTVTGRADYQVGDISRDVLARMGGAKDRAAKLLALPGEVDQLKQIVMEQQVLINSLTAKQGSQAQAKELMAMTGSADDLKPLILEQQQVIDVLLSSADEEASK